MPARRRYIDATTGDYVLVKGAPKNDNTFASAVVLRFRLQRGSSPLFPELGSRFHTIRKIITSTPRLVEAYAVEAVQDLIDRGDIREFKATAKVVGNAIQLTASFRDQNGNRPSVTYRVTVGGSAALAA